MDMGGVMNSCNEMNSGAEVNNAAQILEGIFLEQGRFDREQWALFLELLENGKIRVVDRLLDGSWKVNAWVKQAILSGFRAGGIAEWSWPAEGFYDRPAFPPRHFARSDGVRIVPGGSAVRRGAYIAQGVVIMPPSYINTGAFVDQDTMVDSHVLVGSCAQIGKKVHLSAGAQIGGVLEPPQANPVIIEDEVFIGGMCGIFEGILVKKRAVLAPGVIITKGTRIFDLVRGMDFYSEVPENAVVVPGTRPARGSYAEGLGISLASPCIVKYRDEKTDSAVILESALRG
ncbi:MAG TPA: 2,3,4,5-tetrahydropyridine-2,6-dicarboxylate N-succinyltransferase [Rectinema sp.]|jgi:2,3,4,5-tetrahydropyridine-2-carboxylate N-succinyltransferase|nr:2,3,4,5-tetrahydropyridine-2,6-dicarboxylate N-succinyltransferase [Rectinema sp.]HPY05924.1 2,3,4,5-tetrahydropyridine-2,6-dicarboxylate N-succinyltransferase [Rectinema sp.]